MLFDRQLQRDMVSQSYGRKETFVTSSEVRDGSNMELKLENISFSVFAATFRPLIVYDS